MYRPVIGITTEDVIVDGVSRYQLAGAYCKAIIVSGGLPVLLGCDEVLIGDYVDLCDGFVFSGGDDPVMEVFGEATYAKAKVISGKRQAFEVGLLGALSEGQDVAVLGICLGMQMMALSGGGKLDQHLPDVMDGAEVHVGNREHELLADGDGGGVFGGEVGVMRVVSSHHQAVSDAGDMRVVARAGDGVIEGIDDPSWGGGKGFYVGVQYHPERSECLESAAVNQGLFDRLVEAALRISR